MKKIIALALALIMALSMGSVAFAACVGTPSGYSCEVEKAHNTPGQKILLSETTEVGYHAPSGEDAKKWKVSTEWTKGGALVDGVEYLTIKKNDVNRDGWYLILKENYTITTAKDLVGKITFTKKGETDNVVEINTAVSNHIVTIEGDEDADDCTPIEAADNTLYKCDEDAPGYVKFNKSALLSATLNMAGKEKAFMYNDEAAIDALTEKFPEADIECYNFGGQPTFKNAAEFTLQADYADQYYIYAYAGGKLEAQDAEWDSIEGVYTWETKSPVSYVISDVELVAAADDAAQNPDTGANDVVGVAAALAVVSLVAAGAVSLKK